MRQPEPPKLKPVPRWKYALAIGLLVGGIALLLLCGVALAFSMFGAPAVIGGVGVLVAVGLISTGVVQINACWLEARTEKARYKKEKELYKKRMASSKTEPAALNEAQDHHSGKKQKARLAVGADEPEAGNQPAEQPALVSLRSDASIRRRKKTTAATPVSRLRTWVSALRHSTNSSKPASVAKLGVMGRRQTKVSSGTPVPVSQTPISRINK